LAQISAGRLESTQPARVSDKDEYEDDMIKNEDEDDDLVWISRWGRDQEENVSDEAVMAAVRM